MGSDLSVVLIWWFYILLLGLIFLPVTKPVFEKFFDKGYLFAKTAAIALASYAVWLLSSIRLMAFSRAAIFTVLAAAFLIIYIIPRNRTTLMDICKENRYIFLSEEALFLLCIVFWSYIRGMEPGIYGLEKFMDFGFVNTILRTRYMPPLDMWLAGNTINYYYFGHYICAFLSKLTAIDSPVAYNIMIATVFSFAVSLSFSLAGNAVYLLHGKYMKKVIAAGIISSMLLAFGGNMHGFVFAKALPIAKSIGLYKGNVEEYFYADATRYIGYNPPTQDKTIHEFPFYSFVVSDLHGHVSDIPFVITFLAVVLAYITGSFEDKKMNYITGFMLAIFYMTNAWDFPIYLTVAFFALLYVNFSKEFNLKSLGLSMLKIFALSQLMLLFYTLNFKNITGGIGFVHSRTPSYQLFILWGYQFFLTACFAVFLLLLGRNMHYESSGFSRGEKINRFLKGLPKADMYILILLVSALGLIMIPEIVYVRDIYGPEYHRANTMFKLVYQSFIMFGISGGYIVIRVLSYIKKSLYRNLAALLFSLVLLAPMIYPYYAVKGYYSSIKPGNYKGLDGLGFLKNIYPDDYEAIKWLNGNISGQAVVLEANGDGYTDYERISMSTGLPTVLGWFGHEWLWRGGPEIPEERSKDVALIYESGDEVTTRQLLRKYDVSYIIIGKLEREKFKDIREDKILKLGETVFDSPMTKIVKVK